MLRTHHMIPSMSRPANPYDNASCESFMKTLKCEEIYANTYRELDHLRTHREAFIERYNNRDRLHSALGYRPPEEFERTMAPANTWKGATLRLLRDAQIARTEARGE
jgi:putative transposase